MKKITKLLCLLLALLMLGGVLIGCKKKNPDDGNTDSATPDSVSDSDTVETDEWGQVVYSNPIPDEVNYGGQEFVLYARNSERFYYEFGQEDVSGALETQIYERNMRVQTNLGVRLKVELGPNGDPGATPANGVSFNTTVQNSVLAGQHDIDAVAYYALHGVSAYTRSLLTDFKNDGFTYLNLDRPYWHQSYLDVVDMPAGLFYLVGDANLSVYDRLTVIHYNETMGAGLGVPDVYAMVLDGSWTYENFLQIIQNYGKYEDKDKDGKKSDGDVYAYTSITGGEATDPYPTAWGIEMLKAQDGVYSWNFEGNETLRTATQRVYTLFHQPNTRMDLVYGWNFIQGNVLFAQDIIYRSADDMAKMLNMKDDRGILPVPKYDSTQTEYYSSAQTAYNIMCAPRTTDRAQMEFTSAVLEDMTYQSYKALRPYYFQYICKARYVENSISVKMFDLVLDSLKFDLATVFDNQFKKNAASPLYLFRNACTDTNDVEIGKHAQSLDVAWASVSTAMQTELLQFQQWSTQKQ